MTEALALTALSKHTLAEDVTDRLRDAIFRGHFVPGQRLGEAQLARALGVSRGPIREAFNRLEREGLITSQTNGRSLVAQLSRRDLEEVYTLRLALERLAVQRATQVATAEDFAALEANTQALEAAVTRALSEEEAATLDIEFHDRLYRAAHHGQLWEAWANIRSQVYLFLLSRNRANADYRDRSIAAAHADLVRALRTGDQAQAVAAIEVHLRRAYEYIAQVFGEASGGRIE
ncbi:MAG: GntR family transcriptional regulator [Anaerolineales bacterium]|nr:GntR family transcriptional regulator [Anaerolineales bacterium]